MSKQQKFFQDVMASPPTIASRFVRNRNAEARRTQSSCSRISSALSASPRFKTSPSEIAGYGYVLTPGCYVGAEEMEDDGVLSIIKGRKDGGLAPLENSKLLKNFVRILPVHS